MERRETSEEIDAAAAEWATRVDNAPLSPAEQAALDHWLAGDSRRLGAYSKARAVFAYARRGKGLGTAYDPANFVLPVGPAVRRSNQAGAVSRRRLLAAGIAVPAVAGLAGLALWSQGEEVRTQRGEVRRISLGDGSSLTLNTASVVKIALTDKQRLVRLLAGEALFEVARDAARPFLVDANSATIRAMGASFTVRRLSSRMVEVLVREGIVSVERPAGLGPALQLGANTRAVSTVDSRTVATSVSPAYLSRALAWREGMLSFEDQSLEDAAAEFARYSRTRIVIDDPQVARQTITGLFAANDPKGFAAAVAKTLGLRNRSDTDEVYLTQ